MGIDEIVRRYAAGESTIAIAREADVSHATVANRLRKAGVELRTAGGVLTPTEGRAVAARYAAGESSNRLAEELGLSHRGVIQCAERYGVEIRDRGDYPTTRTHFFCEDFFAKWTPDMAYVLGLVTTDGCVNKTGKDVRIYQKETALLDQVRDVLGADRPYARSGTGGSIPTLVLCSVRMVGDLAKLGVLPAKSLTIRAPNVVRFKRDYVRGVFDGDGHGNYYLHRPNSPRRALRIGFTSGSRGFLRDLAALLPVPIGGPYLNRGCWSLATSREAYAEKLRDWMYAGKSSIMSERKRAKLYR